MKSISLTQGQFALVDDEDFEWLSKMRWHFLRRPVGGGYAVHSSYDGHSTTTVYMHRLIMNAPKGVEVDHIDGDKLNNQRSNLRLATRAENARNQKPQRGRSSQFKGVSLIPKTQRWRAHIKLDGWLMVIGFYATEVEAAKAYDTQARKHFGEFACINFPND